MSEKIKELKINKYKGSLILKIALLCFAAYIIFTLISQQITISEKTSELNGLSDQVKAQEIKNQEIQYAIDEELAGDKQYAEEYARGELGYAKQGERVYVNIGGN